MRSGADLLDARARHLFKVLVERHIRDGAPVGSRTLASESGLDISPATVRSIMVELEELGLVASPHTSAGRVPTDKGYRLFIDALLTIDPPAQHEVDRLRELLSDEASLQQLAVSVSGLLSGVSSMAAVVLLPRRERMILRHIELVPMDGNRVLALLVIDRQEVRSCTVATERRFEQNELRAAANYLNSVFAGRDLAEIRRALLSELRAAQESMDRVVYSAMRMAEQVFTDDNGAGDDVVVSGQTRLMGFEDLSDIEKLRVLFETFDEKRKMLHLLDQCLRNGGLQVLIGKESGVAVLDDCSLVTSTYGNGHESGVIGVIGPMRMSYRRVIPLVDMAARMVSAALNRHH